MFCDYGTFGAEFADDYGMFGAEREGGWGKSHTDMIGSIGVNARMVVHICIVITYIHITF